MAKRFTGNEGVKTLVLWRKNAENLVISVFILSKKEYNWF